MGAVDWTTVIVAVCGALPGTLAALVALTVRRQLKTPSGDHIGAVVERSHDITSANFALLKKINGIEEDK